MNPDAFDALSAALTAGSRADDRLLGLVLLGSASESGRLRRDDWSDHDFFALAHPGRGAEARQSLEWLPDPASRVLVAREGEIGFAVLYADGHLLEFALAEVDELSGAVAGDASVVVDDEAGSVAALIEDARRRAEASDRFDPANDAALFLVKLMVGVGRVRRGERLNGGQFIRQWAVQHLIRAVRGRFATVSTSRRDIIDPVRRFEEDFPAEGARIAEILDRPAEECARGLFDLARDVLEPGWGEFPTPAADAVAARLGWGADAAARGGS